MKKTKCFIIDDEPPAIQLLEKYISMVDQLEIVGTSYSAIKAFDMLKDKEVDLMFLDIQMPVLNGLDFIKTLSNPPSVILTTAYREYAIDGYDLDIIDYLLKPIHFNRFLKAIDRYRVRTQNSEQSPNDSQPEHIFFNVNRTQFKIFIQDIHYVESLKDYTRLHMANDSLVVKGNIGTTLKQLPDHLFIRIHRSFAIGVNHVASFNKSEVEINGKRLPIGATYSNDVVQKFLSKR